MFAVTENSTIKKWRLGFFFFALLVAFAFDFLFWNVKVLGFGFFLFVSVYTIGFTALVYLSKQLSQPRALWLLLPILILAIDVLVFSNLFVQHFVPLLMVILLFAYSFLLTLKNPEKINFDFLKLKFLKNLGQVKNKLSQLFSDFDFSKSDKNSELYKKILLGVLASLPILLVFFALFLSADSVFAHKVYNLFDFKIEPSTVFRIFRFVFFTFAIALFFYILLDSKHKIEKNEKKFIKIDKTIVTVILSLINILFASFVVIQLQYLFGSTSFVADNGLRFADYARQGFFQLAWVIVLSAIILIVFYRSASEHGSHIALKLLKIFLILQVGVIAMSALKRMNLYQDAYGFTTLRLYVEWFIYFCLSVITFTAISLSIDFEFRKFFNISVVLGVLALTIVSSLNVDKVIAKKNIDRYLNDNKAVDLDYLSRLSSDALEEIKRLPDKVDTSRQSTGGVMYYSDEFKNNPKSYIISILQGRYHIGDISWKEFNFSVYKLKKI